MRESSLVLALIVAATSLTICGPAAAQTSEAVRDDRPSAEGPPDPPEWVFAEMVSQSLAAELRLVKKPCVAYVAADNVQIGWLPSIPDVEIILLTEAEAQTRESTGLKYYTFTAPERVRHGYRFGVGFGDRTSGSGRTYRFAETGGGLKLKRAEGGFGWSSSSGH